MRLSLLVVLAWLAAWSNDNTNGNVTATDERPLSVSQTIEREIAVGQTHLYRINTNSNQFLSVEIENLGLELSGTLSEPTANNSVEFTSSNDEPAVVSLITVTATSCVFSVRGNTSPTLTSRYTIRIKQLRPSTATDSDRLNLERALADNSALGRMQKRDAYEQALERYRAAISQARNLADRELEARALRSLGITYERLNLNEEALKQYREAARVAQSSGDLSLRADIANSLAYYHSNNGNFREALTVAERAWQASRQAQSPSRESSSLFVLGEALYGLGDLRRALESYNRALAIRRSLQDRRGQAQVLVNLGYTYSSLSDTPKAREVILEARTLSVAAQNSYWEARSLRALGILHTRLGEYQSALDSFLQALRIFDSIHDRLTQATVLAGIGFTYENLGEEDKALGYDNEAIAIFREIKNPWGEAELQMDSGRVLFKMGRNGEALERYQRALVLLRSLGITRMEAQTLRDMGRVHEASGETSLALDFYRRSLALSRTGQDERAVAYTLNYVGRIHERAGDRRRALEYLEQALRLNRRAADPAGEAFTLFQIARVRRDLGDLPIALAHIEASVQQAESLRSKVASRDVRASFVASTHHYHELHADILMQLHRLRPHEHFAEAALEATEKARARSFVESLQEAHQDIGSGVDPALLDRERSLRGLLDAKLTRRAELAGKLDQEAQELTKEIDRLSADYDSLRAQIRLNNPHYAALTEAQPLTLREIQARVLDQESLLLEYLLGEERSYVWVISSTDVSSFELPSRVRIEGAAHKFRELLLVNQSRSDETFQQYQVRLRQADAEIPEAAAALADLLIGPLQHQLGKKRLIIVPDGALHYIPFQALEVPATSGERVPLLVDHEIVYEPSASALALVLGERARRYTSNTVAVFAHPVFEADDSRVTSNTNADASAHQIAVRGVFRDLGLSDKKIPALPASREEAEAILSMVPWGTGLKALGFDANRAAVTKPELANYRIVHFATHAFVDSEHPELSGLVLSLVDRKGQPQDGHVRLHDIYNLNLSADLVVLSACNTGLGKEIRGEGVVGLTRGFMYAGAGGVAASLWKVDDEATAELMKRFYEGMLKRSLTPSAAMRDAQLSMWRQKRWHAPYNWAGFIIQGRYDQNLSFISPSSRAQWLVVLAGLVSAAILASFLVFPRRRTRLV